MPTDELKNQMPLFGATPAQLKRESSAPDSSNLDQPETSGIRPREKTRNQKVKLKNKVAGSSGQVPAGDVRLTANISEDLHLKLKIAAAKRRTTIGDLIEEMIDKHLQ